MKHEKIEAIQNESSFNLHGTNSFEEDDVEILEKNINNYSIEKI